jgi:Holliday junction DNA helicase RuvA
MIGKLTGKIDQIYDDHCILDVSGVGYVVFITQKTFQSLQNFDRNTKLSLIIETKVKEDAIELYGFASEIEKIWFIELMKVQGVGAKMSQKILSSLAIEEIAQALITSDTKTFSKISGIGPKLALRITTELKNSPQKLGIDFGDFPANNKQIINNNNLPIINDAVSALENLGYKKHDCLKIIDFVFNQNQQITLENLITSSLRELAKKK